MHFKPRDNGFHDLFARAAGNALVGASLMESFTRASLAERPAYADKIKAVEHEGDDVTHEIMQSLSTAFITPFDREDIARLTLCLDDVLDALDDAAELAVLYRVGDLPDAVERQAVVVRQAAELTVEMMPRLRKLTHLEDYWIQVNDLENTADEIHRALLADLFDDGLDAVDIIKIKGVVDQFEAAANAFEHVADAVQTIALKES